MNEVSGVVTKSLIQFLDSERRQTDLVIEKTNAKMFESEAHDRHTLMVSSTRVGWNYFCAFVENMDLHLDDPNWPTKFAKLSFTKGFEWFQYFRPIMTMGIDPRRIYAVVVRWGGPQYFRIMNTYYKDLASGELEVGMTIDPTYRGLPRLFEIIGEILVYFPKVFSLPPAEVNKEIHPHQATFTVKLDNPHSFWPKAKHYLYLVTHPREALTLLKSRDEFLYDNCMRLLASENTLLEQQARLEERVRERTAALENANEAKSLFLASMSHEIRTPLNAILGFAHLLVDSKITERERVEFGEAVYRNGEVLLRIIDDILDLAKVESGQMALSKVDFPFRRTLEEVLDVYYKKASSKGLEMSCEFHQSAPPALYSDPVRVRQIFGNLLDNAIKYSDKGKIRVDVWGDQQKGVTCIVIEDTGVGIGAERFESIFEPFARGEMSAVRKIPGTGLGLPLSRRLARALGGDVVLKRSTPDSGSVFSLQLPAKFDQSDAKAGVAGVVNLGQPLSPADDELNHFLDGISVLVVEDNDDNQLLISLLLKKRGGRVVIAQNGQVALEELEANSYDLVLMDLQMPVLDGYETIRRLRKNSYMGKVFAITAHAMKDERDKALAAGFDDYLTKPIDIGLLYQKIQEGL